MIEFFNRLFGRQSSGATAKERLRLVLMSDHLSLAPEMIESMKRDFVDVISRYVEVDRDRIDVHFEHQDKALAMLANIPITGVSRNGSANGTNGHHANGHTIGHTEPAEVSSGHAELAPDEPASESVLSESKGPLSEVEASPRHAEPVDAMPEPLESRNVNAKADEAQSAQSEPAQTLPNVPRAKPKASSAKNAGRPRRKRRKL